MKKNIFMPLTIASIFFTFATFSACTSDSDYFFPIPSKDSSGYYYASVMSQTQIEIGTSGAKIRIDPTTSKLLLSGVSGKSIYMTRVNNNASSLAGANTRIATGQSGFSASVQATSALSIPSAPAILENLESPKKDDLAAFYEKTMKSLQSYSTPANNLISKSTPNNNGAQDYAVGNERNFYVVTDMSTQAMESVTFKLLAKTNDYYIWVNASDSTYTNNESDFTTKAEELGADFIQGYGLVKRIYGEVADHLYYVNNGKYTKGPAMSSASDTGTRINLMFSALTYAVNGTRSGAYGYFYAGDFLYNYENGNNGRFLYLDTYTLMDANGYSTMRSTAQHEFSHAISRTKKDLEQGISWTYWYGELLAMTCEDMMQSYLGLDDSKTDKSASSICHSPKVRLSQGNCSAGIYGFTGQTVTTYATAYQFSAWLTRKFGGVKLIKEMAQNAYVDMDSIVNAVNTVNGRSYTTESLLEEFAGDLLWEETGRGMNQAAATYSDSVYTCTYTDSSGEHTYNYPLTAINLWNPFYVWYDSRLASYAANSSIAFSSAPIGNTYRSGTWASGAPSILFKGPFMFKTGNGYASIGPYGYTLAKIGVAASDTVTVNFSCAGGVSFGDTLTIWVK